VNQKDREALQGLEQKVDKLLSIAQGDPEIKYTGLLERQDQDEKFQKLALEKLETVESNQRDFIQKLEDHAKRIQILEQFYKVFKKLSTIKRKTVLWIGKIALIIGSFLGGIASLWSQWEKVKAIFSQLFHR